jgi:hypothetical protein
MTADETRAMIQGISQLSRYLGHAEGRCIGVAWRLRSKSIEFPPGSEMAEFLTECADLLDPSDDPAKPPTNSGERREGEK